jgi:hypothetical protein
METGQDREQAPPRRLVRVHADDHSYRLWKEVARKNGWSLDFTLRRVLSKAADNYLRGDSLGIDPPLCLESCGGPEGGTTEREVDAR